MEDFSLIYMGTPAFALPPLRALVYNNYRINAVITQPDKPRGRGKKLIPTPVKEYAGKAGLPCLEPGSLKDPDFLEKIRELSPSLIVTAAYGKILPPSLLELPPLGCINLHFSLLPRYRGAAPVQRAIMEGEKETGVTVFFMDRGMDTGDIILQEKAAILEGETAGELLTRLADLGAEALVKAVGMLKEGRAPRRPQDPGKATEAPPLWREEELIDWQAEAERVASQINGLSPSPGSHSFLLGRRLKFLRALAAGGSGPPGRVLDIGGEGFLVAAGRGAVQVLEVQPEGKKPMPAGDFARGYRIGPGALFDRSG